jgi:hypothetical protein
MKVLSKPRLSLAVLLCLLIAVGLCAYAQTGVQKTKEELLVERVPVKTTKADKDINLGDPVVSLNLSAIARFFRDYGPWGLVVVMMIALVILFRAYERQRREFDAAMQERHEQFVALIEKLTNSFLNRSR